MSKTHPFFKQETLLLSVDLGTKVLLLFHITKYFMFFLLKNLILLSKGIKILKICTFFISDTLAESVFYQQSKQFEFNKRNNLALQSSE